MKVSAAWLLTCNHFLTTVTDQSVNYCACTLCFSCNFPVGEVASLCRGSCDFSIPNHYTNHGLCNAIESTSS